MQKTELQDELDAAVLAGTVLEHTADDSSRLAAAYSMVGYDPLKFGITPETDIVVGTNTVSFSMNGTSVSGITTIKQPIIFPGIFGSDYFSLSVHSTAKKIQSDPICILALNKSEDRSMEIYGNATVKATNCAAMANSTDNEAIKQYGKKSRLEATMIGVTGSFSGTGISPTPLKDIEPVIDPYKDINFPNTGPCVDVASRLSKASFTLNPGTYCGGLNLSAHADVTLNPGVYIMKDGLFSMGAGAKINGTEVMIAFTGRDSYIYTNAGSEIHLTSPKTGIYANMQFMSDRVLNGSWKNEEWATLSDTTISIDGVLYLPEQDVWLKGGTQLSVTTPTMAMIADQFWIQDTSDVVVTRDNVRGMALDVPHIGFNYSARLAK